MTIDEAITLARAEADLQRIYAKEMREITRDFPLDYGEAEEKRAEEHEQLAEWLEKLKYIENIILEWNADYFNDEDKGIPDNEILEAILNACTENGFDIQIDEDFREGYNKAIDDFSHELKEAFNLEIPLNYPSTKPFFTLENARKLVEDVAEQLKDGGGE